MTKTLLTATLGAVLAFTVASLLGCQTGARTIAKSPVAEAIPACPSASKESEATATYSSDAHVQSWAGRRCSYESRFSRGTEIYEFANVADADSFIRQLEDLARENAGDGAWVTSDDFDWRPADPVDRFSRTEFRSDEDCGDADRCAVQDLIQVRIDRWVLRVSGVDRDASFLVAFARIGEYGVVGHAGWTGNEGAMELVLHRFLSLPIERR